MLKQDIAAYVDGWVIKRETDAAPRRILAEDIDFLNELVSQQQGKVHAIAWQALSTALSGWLVQRARGERPGALGASDFEAFLAFLPASSDPQAMPDPAEETVEEIVETQEISALNDGSAPLENPAPENLAPEDPAPEDPAPENPVSPPASETPAIEMPESREIPAPSEVVTAPELELHRQLHEVLNPDRLLMLRQDIAAYVADWVIKRETDAAPRRILAEDIDFLNELVSQQQGKVYVTAWQALSTALSGWLVQRARGARPGALGASDFEAFLAFLSALSDPQATPAPAGEIAETQLAQDLQDLSAMTPPASRPRRQAHEAPNPDRFAGLPFSRYHVENGV